MNSRWPAKVFAAVMAAALLSGGGLAVGLGSDAEGAVPALKVTVYCYSARERTVIKNRSSKTVKLKTVGSLYKPYSNEPFTVTKSLAPGKSVTYYTGSGASNANANTLTRRSIYNNSVGTKEGARVRTTTGKTYIDRC